VNTVQYVDTYELARSGAEISGSVSLLRFGRLLAGLPEQADTPVDWSVKGMKNATGQVFLTVRVKALPLLECQRCLGPFAWPVDAQTRLQVVAESELRDDDSGDLDDPDDLIERIAASRRLDILALVEDEIILSLPYVPRHDVCPPASAPSPDDADAGEKRPSPFAALGKLRN